MIFPSCNALSCRILRCFATYAAICEMHRILSKLSFRRKMRQISGSKRSQNVVEIAKTDYCGFGPRFLFILPHPSISRYRKTLLTITISRALVLFPPYQTALKLLCVTGLCSPAAFATSSLARFSSSRRTISLWASSSPRWVYVFMVTPMSE